MKGAVHGVAATVASAPVKNEPGYPGRAASPWPAPVEASPDDQEPREAQAHREQQVGQGRDDQRGLELEAPADLGASRAQREQRAGQRREADQHAGRVGEAMPAHDARGCLGMADEGQSLYRQHR